MDKCVLLKSFLEEAMGKPLDGLALRRMSGKEVLYALWSVNDIFKPHFDEVRALRYDAAFEDDADVAITKFIAAPIPATASSISKGAWRVLLERHSQAITVASMNAAAGNSVMSVPEELPDGARLGAAMIFLLYQMDLPWPPSEQPGC